MLLRIDAGTDETRVEFGAVAFRVERAALELEAGPDGKPALWVRVTFEAVNKTDADRTVTFSKGALVTPKSKTDLLVKTAKGEPFSRTVGSGQSKFVEYGAILPPRQAAGTRAVAVFEVECEVEKKPVRKTLRTPVLLVTKK